uniref:Protein phosphatase 1 regulatory subunit 8 n=2 Tax=Sarcophilus harrisii TaxID=9305 RepID=A0A7N4UYK8_SARHA
MRRPRRSELGGAWNPGGRSREAEGRRTRDVRDWLVSFKEKRSFLRTEALYRLGAPAPQPRARGVTERRMRRRRPGYWVLEMGGASVSGREGGGARTDCWDPSPRLPSPVQSSHFPACFGFSKWEGETQDGGSRELRLQSPAVRLPDLKLIIDEKKYYLFGRNPDLCDFTIDHQSCSRVHAALVYHKHLKRVFLIDLNSTHGTFLGHIRLEPHKPQQIPIDSTVSFGASTRAYTLREKPQTLPSAVKGDEKMGGEDDELKGLLGLPEEETELDNLTEFNTAHNKRISTLTIEEGNLDIQRPKRKRKNSRVTFSEDDEIINPEDVDPSVGRFRNMVQTAVVPVKKKRVEGPGSLSLEESVSRRMQNFPFSGGLYGGLPPTHSEAGSQSHGIHGTALIGGLPMPYPNLAPEVDLTPVVPSAVNMNPAPNPAVYNPEAVNEPKKKKYAKEAWPGKKPTPSLLI